MAKHTILFLAANPQGASPGGLDPQARRVALDQEASAVRKELKLSGYRDRFELVTRWAAEPHDLLRELRELKPTVVHFSGHGGQGGLFFQAPNGEVRAVSSAAIAETFGAAGSSVKLVVLSACYSEAPAEALLAHVDCVVGMSSVLHDDMARAFAIGFYGALGDQESVAAAYRHGNAAISLEGLPDADRPQLKVRAGVDAAQIILAAVAPVAHVALPCPYPGMRPYSADDADHFHGRGAEIDELIGRLRAGEREIYVIGPSGSGKSSLVAAGVLPRLVRGAAGLGQFVVRSMRPGEHPAARLGELLEVADRELTAPSDAVDALLSGRAVSSSVLILIDQLEELFTLADAGERERFLRALEALRAAPRCVVVFTLRADFFGAFMESPLWTDRDGRISRIEVAPLRGEALTEAIVRPARDLGVSVEPELTERLLADAGSEPGILPLLQETLVQLWDRRQGQTLTLADYQALGDGDRSGLAVAISRRADALLRDLTRPQEAIARRILLRLISFGEGRSDTRRQQPRSKLWATDDDAADFDLVLRRLIADRLLTADEDDLGGEARVDLAHEIMIAAWPTLAGWIQTHRAEEQRRRQLETAAAQWVEHGRGPRGLLDPIELADAEAWQRTESARELGQSADVTALVAASRAAHDKQRRRRRGLVWGVFAALAIAIFAVIATLAVTARYQAREAEARRKRAEDALRETKARERELRRVEAMWYQEPGRQQLLDGHPQQAMAYLAAARQKGEAGESLRMLISMATRSLPIIPLLEHRRAVWSAAFSPDGTRVVTASDDHTACVWDAATGKPITTLEHLGTVWSAAFSPDGTRVVTASNDNTAQVWDAATGKLLGPAVRHQGAVRSAAFSPDGTRIVIASDDHTARIWDAATGQPLTPALQHQGDVRRAAFSPDGTRVVTASTDKTARVWDAATGKLLAPALAHQGAVWSAAFSPDGTRVVTASDDHTACVWDAATGKAITTLEHLGPVWSAAFSPDGTRVVTASNDNTARVWDAATGIPLTSRLKHQAPVWSAAFSPDGTRVVTASNDNTARVWDIAPGTSLARVLEHQGDVWSAAFSPDGTRVVTASNDHSARVWDAAAGKSLALALQHQGTVWSAAFSPDGTRVVTASTDNSARVWNAATGKPLTPALAHQGTVISAAFNPDGTRVVTASDDQTARVWDAATGNPLTPPLEHQDTVWRAAFSPDGTRVVTASTDKTARVWDAATGKPITPALEHQEAVWSAAFSPDGTRVVTASTDKTARVWDAATGKPITPALEHQETVWSAAFSPDGTRVVTASMDRTAQVWDAATGKRLVPALAHQRTVRSAAFSPDGTRIVTASDDLTAQVWDAAIGKPLAPALEHQGAVSSAAFSPDGTRVVTASDDQTARVWDAGTGKPLAPALEHQGVVRSAAFSPDGTRVVTASGDSTARVWETPLDQTPVARWSDLAARSPFVLNGSVHVLRGFLAGETGARESETLPSERLSVPRLSERPPSARPSERPPSARPAKGGLIDI